MRHRLDLARAYVLQHLVRFAGAERRGALHGGEKRRTQGEHVRRRGRALAVGHLGRGERGSTAEPSVVGQRHLPPQGDAEVGELREVVLVDQDVARFHVPVHDVLGVHGIQRGRDLHPDPRDPLRRQPAIAGQHLVQALRRRVLHHEPAFVGVHRVEHRDRVRVVDLCRGLRLAAEPEPVGLARHQVRSLERHRSFQLLVESGPDDPTGSRAACVFELISPVDNIPRAHST
jgi:hypothetical protein